MRTISTAARLSKVFFPLALTFYKWLLYLRLTVLVLEQAKIAGWRKEREIRKEFKIQNLITP